eukprot:TRINITY_DN351_c0_g1_i7.p1 TRINITY_DN351_c0_g1~~TRINITY_DN351_c0_g1_i7.p1  ORF type:complete len:1541 (-),score=425.02 TRINITY_DN351_c0_g1_i7:87-4709(-)
MTVQAPTRASYIPGPAVVTVTNPDGSSGSQTYSYVGVVPSMSPLSPNQGSMAGGYPVTVTGSAFASGAIVRFGNSQVTSFISQTLTRIVLNAPAGSAGLVDVRVDVTDVGTSGTQQFTYIGAPVLNSINPSSGSTNGGMTVTLFGSSFAPDASVSFDGQSIAKTWVSLTQIKIVVPAEACGTGRTVQVSVVSGPLSSASFNFVYVAPAPQTSSFGPLNGPVVGGNIVTLIGSNYGCDSVVLFNNVEAVRLTRTFTSITARAPAAANGQSQATVSVKTTGGQTSGSAYQYIQPVISSVVPSSGSVNGGYTITILGSNFESVDATVSFGGVSGTVTYDASWVVLVTVPPATGLVGGPVNMIVGGGYYGPSPAATFTYIAPQPTLSGISPTSGNVAGGNLVTLTGNGFSADYKVIFGAVEMTASSNNNFVVSVTYTRIVVKAPSSAVRGSVTVAVSTGAGTTSGYAYNYVSAPVLTSVSPSSGNVAGGYILTLSGNHFGSDTVVTFNGAAANIQGAVSVTSIKILVPEAAGRVVSTVNIVVSNAIGSAPALSFSYTTLAPTLSSLVPAQGWVAGGDQTTILGTNFDDQSAVSFGATSATVISRTFVSLVVSTPANAVRGETPVTVTNSGGFVSAALLFTYVAKPVLTSVSPASGDVAGDFAVTIVGNYLLNNVAGGGSTSFKFGTLPAASVNFINEQKVVVTAPEATGRVAVTLNVVATNTQGSSNSLPFVFTAPPPTVASIAPNSGDVAGGILVTVLGNGFDASTTVQFGASQPFVAPGIVTYTQLILTVPTVTVRGPVVLTVKTSGGTFSPVTYTYTAKPKLFSIVPASGSVVGGYPATISGDFLGADTVVTFGSFVVSAPVSTNNNQFIFIVPEAVGRLQTTVQVSALNAQGSAANTLSFNYIAPVPVITSITPVDGDVAGGSQIVLVGTGFDSSVAVTFNGASLNKQSSTYTSVVIISPPFSARGPVPVLVSTSGGQSNAVSFTYTSKPVLAGVAPNSGLVAGGYVVVLTGDFFGQDTTVTFGSVAADVTEVVDAQHLRVSVPEVVSRVAGNVNVVAHNNEGDSSAVVFHYIAPVPVVTSMSASESHVSGGAAVTLTGSDFASDIVVVFGNVQATPVGPHTLTQIVVSAPAVTAPGTLGVHVVTSGGTSQPDLQFVYTSVPVINHISPVSGDVLGGNLVTLAGSSFTASASVSFGSFNADIVSHTLWQLVVVVPSALGEVGAHVLVTVTNDRGVSNSADYQYIAPVPVITAIAPAFGDIAGGILVTITGTGFGDDSQVTIGGAHAARVSRTPVTRLVVHLPPRAIRGSVQVQVTTGSGPSNMVEFVYTAVPVLSSMTPTFGSIHGNKVVTLTGEHFGLDTVIKCGALAFVVESVDYNHIVARTPAVGASITGVTVTASNAQGVSYGLSYTYYAPAPVQLEVRASAHTCSPDGDAITFTADASSLGQPFADVVIQFSYKQVSCTGTTNSAGVAVCTAHAHPDLVPGVHIVTASYTPVDVDAFYPASAFGSIVVGACDCPDCYNSMSANWCTTYPNSHGCA